MNIKDAPKNTSCFPCECSPYAAVGQHCTSKWIRCNARLKAVTNWCLTKEYNTARLDSKVHGVLVKNETGEVIPSDEYVVFRAHDISLLPTLLFYKEQCQRDGAEDLQLKAIGALIERARTWQEAHPERLKVADVKGDEL